MLLLDLGFYFRMVFCLFWFCVWTSRVNEWAVTHASKKYAAIIIRVKIGLGTMYWGSIGKTFTRIRGRVYKTRKNL